MSNRIQWGAALKGAVIGTVMAAFVALPGVALGDDSDHPGYVDFDGLSSIQNAAVTVDVRVGGWLMDIARQAADDGDEDTAMLRSIDNIRVRVFEITDNADDFRAQAEDILADLQNSGWEEFARVRSTDELVYVMIKGGPRQLDGITVVAIDGSDEAVFVNIAGSIDPDDIARIINDGDLIHADLDIDV